MDPLKVRNEDKCNHTWKTVDKDDSFSRDGDKEVMRKKVKCVRCGKEDIRKVKRRLK